ncbi:hypothetical protein [Agathobaculum sp. Marseille-P7918]|uniref:hypothetical protein n=1 Tax=Agathobaculum sp. Marseille-P7918 TaxID=2479843 RepID=UPI000F63C0A0|nr:hypothetical protein [Agathobaculum sp. Marseille-P7918]
MTLTRAKKLHAAAWGVLVVLWVFAKNFGPIKAQPWQGIAIALCVALLIGLLLLESGLGVEKPDERATANGYKANSLLFNLLNGALVLYIVLGKEMPLTIPYEYALLLMALINLFQDLAFLYYERRAE